MSVAELVCFIATLQFCFFFKQGQTITLSGSTNLAVDGKSFTFMCNATIHDSVGVIVFTKDGNEFGKLSYEQGICKNHYNGAPIPCQPETCSCNTNRIYNWTISTVNTGWHRSNVLCYSVFGFTSNKKEIFVAIPFTSVAITPNQRVDLIEGQSVNFTCTTNPASRPSANMEWFMVKGSEVSRIGTNITSQGGSGSLIDQTRVVTSYLKFHPDHTPHTKLVFCRATADSIGSVDSTNITVNVRYHPTEPLNIVSNPPGPMYVNGTYVGITCKIKGGNPLATLTWSCNFRQSTYSVTDVSTATEAILRLDVFLVSEGTELSCTCRASHDVQSFVSTVKNKFDFYVVPIGNPVISAIPDASSYLEGTNVTLTCKVNGGKPLATLSWHCMAASVSSSVRNSNNVTESELFLVMNSNLNNKSCVCMARHPVPSYQKDAEVFFTVFYKPTQDLVIQTDKEIVNIGDDVTIKCGLSGGNPLANVSLTCGDITGSVTNTLGEASSTLSLSNINSNSSETRCICRGNHILFPNYNKYREYDISVRRSPTSEKGKVISANNLLKWPEDKIVIISIGVGGLVFTVVITIIIVLAVSIRRKKMASSSETAVKDVPAEGVTKDGDYCGIDRKAYVNKDGSKAPNQLVATVKPNPKGENYSYADCNKKTNVAEKDGNDQDSRPGGKKYKYSYSKVQKKDKGKPPPPIPDRKSLYDQDEQYEEIKVQSSNKSESKPGLSVPTTPASIVRPVPTQNANVSVKSTSNLSAIKSTGTKAPGQSTSGASKPIPAIPASKSRLVPAQNTKIDGKSPLKPSSTQNTRTKPPGKAGSSASTRPKMKKRVAGKSTTVSNSPRKTANNDQRTEYMEMTQPFKDANKKKKTVKFEGKKKVGHNIKEDDEGYIAPKFNVTSDRAGIQRNVGNDLCEDSEQLYENADPIYENCD